VQPENKSSAIPPGKKWEREGGRRRPMTLSQLGKEETADKVSGKKKGPRRQTTHGNAEKEKRRRGLLILPEEEKKANSEK